jgi:hypothetical protein
LTGVGQHEASWDYRFSMIEHLEDATGFLTTTAAKQTETWLLSRLSKLSATRLPSR